MARLTSYESVLGSLELAPENVRSQAEFFAAYAGMLETSRTPSDDHDRGWARVAHPPQQQWLGPAALASAYRRAAQYATLVDTRWATWLAVRAGQAYVKAGLPFGLFVLAGVLDDRTLQDSSALPGLLAPFTVPTASPALQAPVQQMYLLMTAASRSWLRDPLAETLEGAVQRLSVHDLQPIGPQGIPLGEYLDIATTMLYDGQGSTMAASVEVRDIAGRLATMYRAQVASLRAARRNRHLWRNGASPFNVVDLEHVAMYGLTLRHRPWGGEVSEAISAELGHDEALAELPVWATESIDAELPVISAGLMETLREQGYAGNAAAFRDDGTPRDDPADGPAAGSARTEPGLRLDDNPDSDGPYPHER
jgi:hypothetical protein